MKKKIINTLILSLFFLTDLTLIAQTSITGEMRNRTEYKDGYKKLLIKDVDLPGISILQRSRLNLDHKINKLSVRFSLQDARVWGESMYNDDPSNFMLYEGWMKYSFNSMFSLKAGRQELNYEDGRILANVNWKNTGATHDAFLFAYKNDSSNLEIHLSGAINNSKEDIKLVTYGLNCYKYLSAFWLTKKINSAIKISFINVMDAFERNVKTVYNPKIIYVRNTSGLYASYNKKKYGVNASGFFQTGEISSSKNVEAYLYSISAYIKFIDKLKITTFYDVYSGTDLSNTALTANTTNSFDKLYGAGHSYLGFMDYFTSPSDTKDAGIKDLYGKISFDATKKINVETTYHYFSLDKLNISSTNKVNSSLGSEIDIILNYKYSELFSVSGGYCFMLQEKSLESIQAVPQDAKIRFPQWCYIMITFKPVFL